MNGTGEPSADRPPAQYLTAEHVVGEMADHGDRRLRTISIGQILVLAMMGGASGTRSGPVSTRAHWRRLT